MSYQLNKTDGTLLTELIDGQLDVNSTNLTLVGKNYTGYGEFFNENFIKLLENFANTAAPSNPVEGQFWWDKTNLKVKIFDGYEWKTISGPYVQETRPQMVAGDVWIDTENKQFYAYDGTDALLIGPDYTSSQGLSGFEVVSLTDTLGIEHTIVKLMIGNQVIGVHSLSEFTPILSNRINELTTTTNETGTIYKGFNVASAETYKFLGIAARSDSLVDSIGNNRTAEQFLPSDRTGVTTGQLNIRNSSGLSVGTDDNVYLKIVGTAFVIEQQKIDNDLKFRIKSSSAGSVPIDALTVKSSNTSIGIFNNNPQYTLDVNGDVNISGNLTIQGTSLITEVETVQVQDKNIELGVLSTPTDILANGGGITLKGDTDKTLIWEYSTNSWTANTNVNLSSISDSYRINNSVKLTNDSLTNITYADDLIRIGTLGNLDVDNININGNRILSNLSMIISAANGIAITVGNGHIDIQDNRKITGLATPTNAQDAANKTYVDQKIISETMVTQFDITGMGTGATLQTNIAAYLNDLYPASGYNGKYMRIHTTSYTDVAVTGIDVDAIKTIDYVAVDSNGTQNVSVVGDVVFDPAGASGSTIIIPTRSLMVFNSNGAEWQHVDTTTYT